MVVEHGQADGGRVPVLEQVADENQVAQGLRHLLALVRHQRLVHPVAHEAVAGGRLRLGRLALVVGEDEVGAAAVQVDGGAQLPHGQGRALDVPAGPARSPERLPRRLVLGRGLPEHEVERIALVGIVGIAAPLGRQRQHVLSRKVADLPEAVELGHLEVDAAAGLVGETAVEHHADEAENVGDGAGGPGLAEGRD